MDPSGGFEAQRRRSVTGPEASHAVIEQRRRSFGDVAEDYEQVRAPWPAETLHWMLGSPEAAVRLQVIDLGAGTGKATRSLALMGHDVLAVDPSEGMIRALRTSTASLGRETAARITTGVGSAEAIPARDASVDAVTVLQAWHWFDEVKAAAECARVLRPAGWLSRAWHTWDPDPAAPADASWMAELADLVGNPEMASGSVDEPEPVGADFSAGELMTVGFDHVLTPSELRTLARSWSFVQVRPDRETVLEQVLELGRRVAQEQAGRGRRDGALAFPQVSVCYRYQRR